MIVPLASFRLRAMMTNSEAVRRCSHSIVRAYDACLEGGVLIHSPDSVDKKGQKGPQDTPTAKLEERASCCTYR
jgi:hypothetical protein